MANPKIVLFTGGGTGGHITPILAVAHEIKKASPKTKTVYVGERRSKFSHLTNDHKAINESHQIFSGKYRRYHGESWLRKVLDVKTNLLNFRDIFLVAIGFFQAVRLIDKIDPDVVFLKGGYVGVPIGLAAALRKKKIVTHDSDAVPGLANRIISRWATLHATALPAENYDYPQSITEQVGVLVQHDYIKVNSFLKKKYKQRLKLPANAPVLVITGGSSGAAAINNAVQRITEKLLEKHSRLHIIHQVGKGNMKNIRHGGNPRYSVMDFFDPMHLYLGAADVVITRASANTLAELGVQEKAAVVVPSPFLADGHQLKNAEFLKEQGAAVVVQENSKLAVNLYRTVDKLLDSPMERRQLAASLNKQTPEGAAKKLANLIMKINETK